MLMRPLQQTMGDQCGSTRRRPRRGRRSAPWAGCAAVAVLLWLPAVPCVLAQQAETPPAPAAAPAPSNALTKAFEGLKIGALVYFSYQDGEQSDGAGGSESYSRFAVKRAYLDVRKQVADFLEVRVTPDVTLDSTGDLKVRLKYAHALFRLADLGPLNDPHVEVGLAHTPWLDFEEQVDLYRMQDSMFVERNGLFSSADLGLLLGAKVGEDLPASTLEYLNPANAGRWGSFALGTFNGGGYHAAEENTNKTLEGRLTFRPFGAAPGLQLSAFGITGKGNQPDDHGLVPPDWNLAGGMLSWESRRLVATVQHVTGRGNQKGTAVSATGRALPFAGTSAFVELRLDRARRYSVIGRWDRFDRDRDDPASDVTDRWIAGAAWQFLKGNYVLLDYDRLEHSSSGTPADDRVQLTLQLKF